MRAEAASLAGAGLTAAQRRVMGDVKRHHVAAIFGQLFLERTRQASRLCGFGISGITATGDLDSAAATARWLCRTVVGFEQAWLTILPEHEESPDSGLVFFGDQQFGVCEPIVLGIERVIFGLKRLDVIAILGAVDDFSDLCHAVGNLVHPGHRFGTGFGAPRPVGMKVLGVVVGHVGGKARLHPGKAAAEFGDVSFVRKLLRREVHGKFAINPDAFAFAREEVALDPAAAGGIFDFAKEQRDRMVGRDTFLRNRTPDCLRVVALPAVEEALPSGLLTLPVRR